MDSKLVQSAAAALLISLAMAALAWSVRTLIEATAIVNSLLRNIDMAADVSDHWLMLISSTVFVAILMGVGYLLLSRRLKKNSENSAM